MIDHFERLSKLSSEERETRLLGFFQRLNDWSTEKREYFLKEQMGHLANAGSWRQLHFWLTNIRFIDVKCAEGLVHELVTEYDYLITTGISEEAKDYRDFIRKHAQRLTNYRDLLFTLICHEGPSVIRERAESLVRLRLWSKPWLRTTAAWMPPREEIGTSPEMKILSRYDYGVCTTASLAIDRQLCFFLKGLGQIGMVDLKNGRQLPAFISVQRLPPLAMVCSADGQYIALPFENGEAELLRLDYDANGVPIKHETLKNEVRVLVPQFEPPVMEFVGENLWYQAISGKLTKLSYKDLTVSSIELPFDFNNGELSGIASTHDYMVITLRQNSRTLIVAFNGDVALSGQIGADVVCLCACGLNLIAVAFVDQRLRIFDITENIIQTNEIYLDALPSHMVYATGALYWIAAAEFGSGFVYTWKIGTADSPRRLAGNSPGFPKVLSLACRVDTQGIFFGVMTVTASISFEVRSEGIKQAYPMENVFEADRDTGYYAIQKRQDDLWLLDGVSQGEQRLPAETDLLYVFGVDSLRHLLGVSRIGKGFVMNLSTYAVRNSSQMPLNSTSIAGNPDGGFWLADSSGAIYFVDLDCTCTQIIHSNLMHVSKSTLYAWPDLVIWSGIEHGVDSMQVIRFFQPERQMGVLHGLGEQRYSLAEGLFQVPAYHSDKDELVLVWLNGDTLEPSIRVGTPREFLRQQEKRRELAGIDPVSANISAAKFALDGSGLCLLSQSGNLFFVGINWNEATFRVRSILSISIPITGIAEGNALHSSVIFNSGGSQLFFCRFEEEQ